jgi:hypothetical protein
VITIYPVGSTVLIDKEIHGVIVRVSLVSIENTVCYSVEWWDGRKIESRDFDAFRVSPGQKGVQPIRVGFHKD